MPRSRPIVGAFVAASLLAAGLACRVAAQETRQVLYSLEPGEALLQAESVIALTVDATDIVLVTGKGKSGPFFAVRDGARKGPFAKLEEAMQAAYAGRKESGGEGRDCAIHRAGPPPASVGASVEDGARGQVLRFKGATIGPHAMITSRSISPDGAIAYATAADNDAFWFEASDGRKVSFGGTPSEILIGPDGKNAAGEAVIRRRIGRRHFHVARFRTAETYEYADVALFAFRGWTQGGGGG